MQADAQLNALQLSKVNTFLLERQSKAVKQVSPELDPELEGCTDLLSLVKCLVIMQC